MTTTMQIVWGSILLLACSGAHLSLLIVTAGLMRRFGDGFSKPLKRSHWGTITAIAFIAVIAAHTIQVWLWAISFIVLGALNVFNDALYFALVTYTTLGYGDVVVGDDFRIFAAMAAVTGLLNFGLSTAFLVGLLAHLLPEQISR